MITYLSSKLTEYLCRNAVIDSEKAEIYQYGYEVFISGMIGFIIAGTLGAASGHFVESLVFLAFFVPLRQLSGGYHADSYLKCNIVFTAVFAAVLAGACFMPEAFALPVIAFCSAFTFLMMVLLAPIENVNKPLDEKQKRVNRRKCLVITPLLSVVSFAMYFFSVTLSLTAALTLFSVGVLMIIPKMLSKKYHD